MKKRGLALLFLLVGVMIISSSFVSADVINIRESNDDGTIQYNTKFGNRVNDFWFQGSHPYEIIAFGKEQGSDHRGWYRAYKRFNLGGNIPAGATINSATLYYFKERSEGSCSNNFYLRGRTDYGSLGTGDYNAGITHNYDYIGNMGTSNGWKTENVRNQVIAHRNGYTAFEWRGGIENYNSGQCYWNMPAYEAGSSRRAYIRVDYTVPLCTTCGPLGYNTCGVNWAGEDFCGASGVVRYRRDIGGVCNAPQDNRFICHSNGNFYSCDPDTTWAGLATAANEGDTGMGHCCEYHTATSGRWNVYENPENTCNNIDDDCDGITDEGCDNDNDNYCDASMVRSGSPTVCPLGGNDCNDNNININPGRSEVCNNVDDNCNGQTDEGFPTSTCSFVCLAGGHNWNGARPVPLRCCGDDANEASPYQANENICDGNDNDCDGQIDEGLLNACGTCGAAPLEICDNGVDDDCDGDMDCADVGDCSLDPVCAQVTSTFWTDMNETQIPALGVIDLGDSARLVASGANFLGRQVNFTVHKNNAFWFDQIQDSEPSDTGNITMVMPEDGRFYFIAYIFDGVDNVGSGDQSYDVDVSSSVDNEPPHCSILSPNMNDIFTVNTPVSFSGYAVDVDDPIEVEWYTSDGQSDLTGTLTPSFSFATDSRRTITLVVKERVRGQSCTDTVDINIIGDTPGDEWVVADILEPVQDETINGVLVHFSGNDSSVIGFDGVNYNCIAGDCPATINDGATPVTPPGSVDYTGMTFTWTFDGDTSSPVIGLEIVNSYSVQGQHVADLDVDYFTGTETLFSDTSVLFSIDTTGGGVMCVETGGTTYWVDGSGNQVLSTDNCYDSSSLNTCCPAGYYCEVDDIMNPTSGVCVWDDLARNLCDDFTTEEDCNIATDIVARTSVDSITGVQGYCDGAGNTPVAGMPGCFDIVVGCTCNWDVVNSECIADFGIDRQCLDGPTGDTGTCSLSADDTTECLAGQRILSWTSDWQGTATRPATCSDGQRTVPCLMQAATLGFFGFGGFMLTITLIIAFYFYRK